MISPTELRLGNIVLFDGTPAVVKAVTEHSVFLEGCLADSGVDGYQSVSVDDDRLQPVPLSDTLFAIIGKYRMDDEFGVQYQYYQNRSTYTVREDEEGYYIGLYTKDAPIHVTPNHFHSLHELQNIHFTQYGEEMEINLKWLKRFFSSSQNAQK